MREFAGEGPATAVQHGVVVMVFRRCAYGVLVLIAGCDLLDQTPIVEALPPVERVTAPLDLSRPDSVLKMIGYVFDRHTDKSADDFGDLLYEGYVYRYDGPGDELDLELDRASEIQVYKNIFGFYENVTAEFIEEKRWIEYGSAREYPEGTPGKFISRQHPDENWIVIQVNADMSFTYTNQLGQQVGSIVRQRFDLAFRLARQEPDSVWQLGSWTDRESQISVKPARGTWAGPDAGR